MTYTRHFLAEGTHVTSPFDGSFDETCDILVVGLGTAGSIAAIAGAGYGNRVIGIESAPLPGGTPVTGFIDDYFYGIRGGLNDRIDKTCDTLLGTGLFYPSHERKPGYPAYIKSAALADAFDKNAVRAYYDSRAAAVITDGNERVCGVEYSHDDTVKTVGAKIVIDAAEGIVCRLLGQKTLGGRRSDGAFAHISRIVSVKEDGAIRFRYHNKGNFAGMDAEEEARLIYERGACPPVLCETYTENERSFGNALTIGRRETAKAETEYVYSLADHLDGKTNDTLLYTFAPVDNSNPDAWNEDDDFIDWHILCAMYACGITVSIDARMLVPKGTDGLLVCGKHIGVGHSLAGSVRMQRDIARIGEAAGTLASLAVKEGLTTREAASRTQTLKAMLAETGCSDDTKNRGICDLNEPDGELWKPIILPKTADELYRVLASDYPSPALIAVRMGLAGDADTLYRYTTDADTVLADNAGIALGLLGDKRALTRIRDILQRPLYTLIHEHNKTYFYPWSRVTKSCNFIKAVILLGRLGDESDLPCLSRIKDGHTALPPEYEKSIRASAAAAENRIRKQ